MQKIQTNANILNNSNQFWQEKYEKKKTTRVHGLWMENGGKFFGFSHV